MSRRMRTPGRAREELRRALRERGLRATSARIAVLEILRATPDALSHADLAARLPPGHDRTTIFRSLSTLARAHLVRRVHAGDRVWRYHAASASDPTAIPATFVCTSCGVVLDLPTLELLVNTTRPPRAIAERSVQITVRGRCDTCARP